MKQRLPWIVAAVAVLIAVAILAFVLGQAARTRPAATAPAPAVTPQSVAAPPPGTIPASGGPAAPVQPPPTPAPTPKPGNTLMGQVVDGAGAPVPNAIATILFTGSSGKQTLRVNAGKDGKFTASGINAPQVDSMGVEADGYERSDIGTYIPLPLDDVFTITLNRLAGVRLRIMTRKGGRPARAVHGAGHAHAVAAQ